MTSSQPPARAVSTSTLHAPSASPPGHGSIVARLLPPDRLALPVLTFSYPLKLIASSLPSSRCLTVFLLSYGGGLVSNDQVALTVRVEPGARLCLLTQGSTKIFKRRKPEHHTRQTLEIVLERDAVLALLPDPLQPFADAAYSQVQSVHLPPDDSASVVLLDWYSEGRSARGEHWSFAEFASRNEFWLARAAPTSASPPSPANPPAAASAAASADDDAASELPPAPPRLMLRDAVHLAAPAAGTAAPPLAARMDGLTVFATLIVRGPRFRKLAAHVLARYAAEPRMHAHGFGTAAEKAARRERGGAGGGEGEGVGGGVVWTASEVRGFVVLKAGARELEAVRGLLRAVLVEGGRDEGDEGDVVRVLGEGALAAVM